MPDWLMRREKPHIALSLGQMTLPAPAEAQRRPPFKSGRAII
ncbi:MAG: hypothetical protein PVH64_09380 [Bacillota bacterium]